MNRYSDERLVAIAQSTGEHAAFNELFKRHNEPLRLFLYSKLADQQLIDDICQETYIKAFIKINKFDGKSSFCTWLFSIAINEHLQMVRKLSVLTKLKNLLIKDVPAPKTDNVEVFIDFINLSTVLSPLQYDAYVLHTIYGYSHPEIVDKTSLPLGSVKSYIAQANKLIKVSSND